MRLLSIIFCLICIYPSASTLEHRHAVFPYVTAGDPKVMHPEEGLRLEETVPPGLPNVPVLEETIKNVLDEARRREATDQEKERLARLMAAQLAGGLGGTLISGPGADSYISAGQAGVDAANAMTVSERFGKRVGFTVNFIGILAGIPFLWFAVSGGAQQLYRAFVAATSGIGVHAYLLSWILNVAGQDIKALTWSLILGVFSSIVGYKFPQIVWPCVLIITYMVAISGVRLFPFIGPFGWTGGLPGVSAVSAFYIWLLILGSTFTLIHMFFFVANVQGKHLSNAVVIGVVCSWIATSGFSIISEAVFHAPCGYIYLKYFSIPSTLSMSYGANAVMALFFVTLSIFGAWINFVRYKQFGLRADGAEAASLLTDIESKDTKDT